MAVTRPFALTVNVTQLVVLPKVPTLEFTVARVKAEDPFPDAVPSPVNAVIPAVQPAPRVQVTPLTVITAFSRDALGIGSAVTDMAGVTVGVATDG